MNITSIDGFSKLSKQKKIDWLVEHYLKGNEDCRLVFQKYWNTDVHLQNLHEEFSENTITNFYMPYSIAPNFLVDGRLLAFPMVTEESSVVAAAAKSAKFWLERGGFKTTILNTEKLGFTHFIFQSEHAKILEFFNFTLKEKLYQDTNSITANMQSRGGGILGIELVDRTAEMDFYYQIKATFDTVDSMGANFINSCLEKFGETLQREVDKYEGFTDSEKKSLQVIMNILSNFTPDCLVRAEVSCKIEDLKDESALSAQEFAKKFEQAVKIAHIDVYRAATHNKGIMNGVDALVIATGNDFRATEACAHAFAAKDGKYKSLTYCSINDGIFRFWIDLPISIGVVGGLTTLHPLSKISLDLLGKPSAKGLMSILGVSGLAQNFAAIRSLVTTGIQKGHMKMHLLNILNQIGATETEKEYFVAYFEDRSVSYHEVIEEFNKIRKIK